MLKNFYYLSIYNKMASNFDKNDFLNINGFPNYKINCYGIVLNKNNKELKHQYKPNGYCYVILSRGNGGKSYYIHRLVYQAFGSDRNNMEGLQIDHWDREKDNNHISNLRIADRYQNSANISKVQTHNGNKCSSSFKGVGFNKRRHKWFGKIRVGNKYFCLGYFKNERNCAWVYNQISKHFRDSNYWLNTLPDDFELPNETEDRDNIIRRKINEINNWVNQQQYF
jgi:hypothetical protein